MNDVRSIKEHYGGSPVEIHLPPSGLKIDLDGALRYPEDFHAGKLVDAVVRFGATFRPLIGDHDSHEQWNIQDLPSRGIFVYEHHLDEARELAEKITALAGRFIKNTELYDDRNACEEYFFLAKAGYDLMRRERSGAFGLAMSPPGLPVSLERGGLVSTRLGLGLEVNSEIHNEVRVITKRTHLKDEPEDYLALAITWRKTPLESLHESVVQLYDFVNPASGASTAGFLLTAKALGVVPARIEHHAIAATRQGVLFNQSALSKMGILSAFEMLFDSHILNEKYYLIDRPVADAGHILRHFLPVLE